VEQESDLWPRRYDHPASWW